MSVYILGAYAIWNFIVFLIYGFDKMKAKIGGWRVSEKTLIGCAVLFGAIGAWAGMKAFRHKTKHKKFKILIPLLVILNVTLLCIVGVHPEKFADTFGKLDNLLRF